MSRWFRHYAGMMRDDKLVRVAVACKQPVERVVWIWGAILESAAEIDEHGRYDVDAAEIAYFLRADEVDVDAVLRALESAGRVASGVVVKWSDRQFLSDRSGAARQAAFRERKRAGNAGGDHDATAERDGDDRVTSPSRHSDAPETETETETETEAEGVIPPLPPALRDKGRKIAMPEGWTPHAKHRAKAAEMGLDCDLEAEKMRHWADSGGARCQSWDARFFSWMHKAVEIRNGGKPSKPSRSVAERQWDARRRGAALSAGYRCGDDGVWYAPDGSVVGDPAGEGASPGH